MQITSYEWFVGRENNKPCLVTGTAPSAENFPYARFKGIYVTCGDGPVRLKSLFTPHYWVNANSYFPIPEQHLGIINGFADTVFVFADSVAYSTRPISLDFLRDKLKVNWFAYDQRHFGGKPCTPKPRQCCDLLDIYPGRLTIQEFIQQKYGRNRHYSSGSSGAIHAFALAVLLGCSPIYIQGIEFPRYAGDYAYRSCPEADLLNRPDYAAKAARILSHPGTWLNTGKRVISKLRATFSPGGQAVKKSLFFDDIPQILADFEYLAGLAAENGIEVYNLSRTSTLNEVRSLKYKDPALLSI